MKAVMISVRPEWCEKILNGEKTVEIRKTHPKLPEPFKVYIYCTKNKRFMKYSEHMLQAMDCLLKNKEGVVKFGDSFTAFSMGALEDPDTVQLLNGKVIAEFTCNMIMYEVAGQWETQDQLDTYFPNSCLTVQQYNDYCKGRPAYGWHISNLKIYDQPKDLSGFLQWDIGKSYRMQHPPQSWCYVESLPEVTNDAD